MNDQTPKCVGCGHTADLFFPFTSLIDFQPHQLCAACVENRAEPLELVKSTFDGGKLPELTPTVLDTITAYHAPSGHYLPLDAWSKASDRDHVKAHWPPDIKNPRDEPADDITFDSAAEEALFQLVHIRLQKIITESPFEEIEPEPDQVLMRFELGKPPIRFFDWLQQYI